MNWSRLTQTKNGILQNNIAIDLSIRLIGLLDKAFWLKSVAQNRLFCPIYYIYWAHRSSKLCWCPSKSMHGTSASRSSLNGSIGSNSQWTNRSDLVPSIHTFRMEWSVSVCADKRGRWFGHDTTTIQLDHIAAIYWSTIWNAINFFRESNQVWIPNCTFEAMI